MALSGKANVMDEGQKRKSEDSYVWKTENSKITLYHKDCIAGIREGLKPRSIDVVVTSPPYNLGVKYGKYDDSVPREEYIAWIASWGKVLKEVMDDRGSLFLNIGHKPSDPWGPFEVVSALRQHFCLQNVIHWIKSIAVDADDVGKQTGIPGGFAVGHYKPINSPRFIHDCHEYIFHLTKNGDVPLDRLAIGVEYQDKSNVSRWDTGGKDLRCRGNTWFVPYTTIQRRDRERPHPATFPWKIPRNCILLHGIERAEHVLDPFLGLGHSALAAKSLGVDFTGFEIDDEYFDYSCRLVQQSKGRHDRQASQTQLNLL